MARAARIALLAAGVLAIGLVAAYFLYARAPSPEEVCDHVIAVTRAEAGASPLDPQTQATLVARLRDRCIQVKRDTLQYRGKLAYAALARCVMRAQTLRDIEAC